MKNKKFKLKDSLNSIIGSMALILMALVIGMGFVTTIPSSKINALTKSEVIGSNISFVSAKTKARTAEDYYVVNDSKELKTGNNVRSYAYKYSTKPATLYVETSANSLYSSDYGNVSLTANGSDISLYDEVSRQTTTSLFIPSKTTHFKNEDGNLEEIFYDETDYSNDSNAVDFFVLTNNYNVVSKSDSHNIESLYLAFGDPSDSTKLMEIKVTGKLYTQSGEHLLSLNSENLYNYSFKSGADEKQCSYWYQYFDLNNTYAMMSSEPNAPTYKVANPSGRYELTFTFSKFDQDGKGSENYETFNYTFYLLDSADYSKYPSILNATLGSSKKNEVNEYFYNFTGDTPSLLYSPSKYNLTYSRVNNEVNENITSTFSTAGFSNVGVTQEYGKITYYKNGNYLKDVYIFTNLSHESTVLEYIYASTTNSNITISTSDDITDLFDNNTLTFEYKLISVLEETKVTGEAGVISNAYTTKTYITKTYANYPFLSDDSATNFANDPTYSIYECVPETSDTATKLITVETLKTYYLNEAKDALYTSSTSQSDEAKVNLTISVSGDSVTISNNELLNGTYDIQDGNKVGVSISKTYYLKVEEGVATLYKDATHSTEVDKTSDFNYSYNANTGKITIVGGELDDEMFETAYAYETNGKTATELKRLLYPNKLSVNYTYELVLDNLGVYNFDYKYLSSYAENSKYPTYVVGSNALPYDYTVNYEEVSQTTDSDLTVKNDDNVTDLIVTYSGYLNEHNSIQLNSFTYTYNDSTLTVGALPMNIKIGESKTSETTLVNGDIDSTHNVPTVFKLTQDSKGIKLSVSYTIGTFASNTTTTTYSYTPDATTHNKKYVLDTKYVFTLKNASSDLFDSDATTEESDSYIKGLLEHIESQFIIDGDDNGFEYRTKTNYNRHTIASDQLTIFGSIAYFSKEDTTTDSGYAKLQQNNIKEEKYYSSDFTSLYMKKNGLSNNKLSASSPSAGFSSSFVDKVGGIDLEKIIVTDTQVFWKNYSTLKYLGKVSESKIYRYTNYKTVDGKLDLDNATRELYDNNNTYFKDIYCKDDGYYEVIIKYSYGFYKSGSENRASEEFYQLFVFIIDNNSPKVTFETVSVEGETTVYETLSPSSYTNKNVRISWLAPTYFQNDIYVVVNKANFDGVDSDIPFRARYNSNKSITLLSGDEDYVANISHYTISLDNKTLYLTFSLPSSSGLWNLDGHYSVTIYYGNQNNDGSKPSVTYTYTSDNKNISDMRILAVKTEDNGKCVVDTDVNLGNKQITNSNFTFRYSKKASGAQIFTYWHKITLTSTSDYDNLISLSNNKTGITTKYEVFGDDEEIDSEKPYSYNYENGYDISNGNYFASTSSCIYLFRMEDEAGNVARYVVFYDTTSPRALISPKPKGQNNIVSDVTAITWGDYKAIKVDATNPSLYDKNFGSYTLTDGTNLLGEALSYISNISGVSTRFNNTRIEKVGDDYYILVPVVGAQITDEESRELTVDDLSRYYFFPVDPITGDKVNLPTFDTNGNVITDTNGAVTLEEYSYNSLYKTVTYNAYEEVARTYITLNYIDGTKTIALGGVSGTGLYTYLVYDGLNNSSLGDLWMNLDKTQTLAYGTFTHSDTIEDAIGLTGESAKAYAPSKLYISSLENVGDGESIPKYELTYMHYAYNLEFYNNYNTISNISYEKGEDNCTYLLITFTNSSGDSKTQKMKLYDEMGNRYNAISYPYSIEGDAGFPDTQGNPTHIYTKHKLDNYSIVEDTESETQRVFSNIINPVIDISSSANVTKEGLYIFKREYKDIEESALGNDSMIVYRIYYVDRSGIISYIPTSSSLASDLYGVGNDISYLLGSNYSDTDNQKLVDANVIKNNQKSVNDSTYSNSDYQSLSIFATNKVETKLTLTTDKYNFNKFKTSGNISYTDGAFSVDGLDIDANKATLQRQIELSFLNSNLFENIFKVNLTLKKGTNGSSIIDEGNANSNLRYNNDLMTKYISEYKNGSSVNTRLNSLSFFYGDSINSYNVTLNDKAGHIYRVQNDKGEMETVSTNYQPNNLLMTFDIKHVAPSGEMYGKYYGEVDYDETQNGSTTSVPLAGVDNGNEKSGSYTLISHYLADGKLKALSNDNRDSIITTSDGSQITLLSTNNETLVFLFAITNDEYMAKIDINNIQIYQNDTKIFDRFVGTNGSVTYNQELMVSAERQANSFICNVIEDVTYYAIIVFDNNLDDILTTDEINAGYGNLRLLDAIDNKPDAKYYIDIHYVGDENDYKAELNGSEVSYYSARYEITIDRYKPMYNLANLMKLDRYTYKGTTSMEVSKSDFGKSAFDEYSKYYNFEYNETQKFYNSDLNDYFFAVDSRENSTFTFESVSKLDSYNGFYIRPLGEDISNYYFSYTPDDYVAYNDASNRGNHPQFVVSKAKSIFFDGAGTRYSPAKTSPLEKNTYYYCPYIDGKMSVAHMLNEEIVVANNYYEIIERDEAGNYRVYGIYIHDSSKDSLSYTYKQNTQSKSISAKLSNSTSIASVDGIEFNFDNFTTNDLYIKASIKLTSIAKNETLFISYNPRKLELTLTNATNTTLLTISDIGLSEYKTEFIEYINSIISNYRKNILDTYGYTLELTIIDRLGIPANYDKSKLNNYEITYSVAGSEIVPQFVDYDNKKLFDMIIPSKQGATYITSIVASQFNTAWVEIDVDTANNSFSKNPTEFKENGATYTLGRGVYRFVITDNFGRTSIYFHEYDISNSQTGGSIKYNGNHSTSSIASDPYTYTANNFSYSYDSSVYEVFIRYTGENGDTEEYEISKEIFGKNVKYTTEELKQFGIISIITNNNNTTITFGGINKNRQISKYEIKTIIATSSSDYKWGDEENNPNIFIYDYKIAIQTAIQSVIARNMKGITLDTSSHLYLTEDFQVALSWNGTLESERIDFGAKIKYSRTYADGNLTKIEYGTFANGDTVQNPGEYSVWVENNLGKKSSSITFTRGDGEISMYAIYASSNYGKTQTKLEYSSYTTINTDNGKTEFHYYVTDDYFSYIDSITGGKVEAGFIFGDETALSDQMKTDTTSEKYITVRVNSNQNLNADIVKYETYEYGNNDNGDTHYVVTYKIYAPAKNDAEYIYRYAVIHFLPKSSTVLVDAEAYDLGVAVTPENNKIVAGNNVIQSVAKSGMSITFRQLTNSANYEYIAGNTLYIDRYYNGSLIETIVIDAHDEDENGIEYTFTISSVGLHQFAIRDLAGRTHAFSTNVNSTDDPNQLYVYLINQILYEVNGSTPINNQVFNESVELTIISELNGLTLYNASSLGITVYRNGTQIAVTNNRGTLSFTSQGYYTVEIVAITELSSTAANQNISSTYNFAIIREDIAKNSFNISKGTNFIIEKVSKIIGNEKYDMTAEFKSSPNGTQNTTNYYSSLIWLSYSEQQNSRFEITLKAYNAITGSYDSFSFNVWINETKPVIQSNVNAGVNSRDDIELYYNAGLLYKNVGACRIEINGVTYATIDENSEVVVSTIKISRAGEYIVKIVSDDDTVLSSYKFIKTDPLNSTTKIIIACACIGVAVLVVLFFLIRKKGKYR